MTALAAAHFALGTSAGGGRPPALSDGDPATGPNTDVVAGPAGYVGTDWGIFSGCHISLSTDGVTWQALGYGMHFGGECDLSGTSKAYFVMVAMDAPSCEGLWRSTNGLDWSLVLAGGGYGRVVEGADGSLLVGQRGADGDHDWRLSRDEGVTWNPVASSDDGTPFAMDPLRRTIR